MTLGELKERMSMWEMRLWSAQFEYEAAERAKAEKKQK